MELKYSKHRQTFAEVRLDRRLDDLAGRLGHQTSHAGQLTNLLDAATGTRVCHQEHRVDIALASPSRRASIAVIIFVVINSRA